MLVKEALYNQAVEIESQKRTLINLEKAIVELDSKVSRISSSSNNGYHEMEPDLDSLRQKSKDSNDVSYSHRLQQGTPSPYVHNSHPGTYKMQKSALNHHPVRSTVKRERTVVISNIMDWRLVKDSKEIKRQFNNIYKGVVITSCFATKGGSVFIQLDREEEAVRVVDTWSPSFFSGGNNHTATKCKLLARMNTSVIVKGVDTSITESDLTHTLEKTYSGVTVTRFVKNKRPMTTVRIDFKSAEEQEDCIRVGIRHGRTFLTDVEGYI